MSSGDAAKATRRQTLCTELLKLAQSADFDKALKSSNRLLHEFPDDALAFQCKIVCCIQIGKFQDVLDFMTKNPKLSEKLGYEKAYCLYRLHKSQAAYECLVELKDNSWRKQELLAQVLYRLERYEECYKLYKEVIKDSSDEYDDERQTNLIAIAANLEQLGKRVPQLPESYQSYEQLFNYGCLLAAQGKFKEARDQFKKAETKCTETLREDGVAEDEIDDEVFIIQLQRAFCDHKLGREKEANDAYVRLLKFKPSNMEVIAVASNNVLCINRDQNIFESKKRVRAMQADGVREKVTTYQHKIMLINICLSCYGTNQFDLSRECSKIFYEKYPSEKFMYDLINAGLDVKTIGYSETLRNLEGAKSSYQTKVQLCIAQHLLREKKHADVIEVLRRLGGDTYRPGVVSALVTMYLAKDNYDAAATILQEAIDYYKKQGNEKGNLNKLWRQSAYLMVQRGNIAGAIQSLEQLRKIDKTDVVTLAQLVVACIKYDKKRAKQLSSELPKPPRLEHLNVSDLESPNWLSNLKQMKRAGREDQTTPLTLEERQAKAALKTEAKKKRKKKNIIPPNADGKADPERWLPKYERAGYRPKKVRKGRVDVGKGTQGATSEASAVFDMSAKPSSSKTQITPPLQTTPRSAGKSRSKGKRSK